MMKQEENKKLTLESVSIKSEPGTSTTLVMQRLPSLRAPRDLTLSTYSQKIPNLNQAKNKKVYLPNLNVERNKQKTSENAPTISKAEPAKSNLRDNNQRRNRGTRNLIQLNHGVFSEGIPGLKNVGRGRGGGGGGGEILQRPTLKLKEEIKVDKEKEESTMKQLLRDDFVDDPTLEPDFNNCPIVLPLLNAKEDPGLKKRSDMKPVDMKENLTITNLFSGGDVQVPDPGYIFFQLPSSMPGLKAEEKYDPHSSSSSGTPKSDGEQCPLTALPSGQIGKLQILKSGRARLIFGDTRMCLEMGTQVAYKQDLISIELDKEMHTGHMMNMGPISARMIATPDWEAMLTRPSTA